MGGGYRGRVASDFTGLTTAQMGSMLDLSITDYGVTRLRLALRCSYEGIGTAYNRWTITNDNADPNVLNEAGFNWTNLDIQIDRVVNPSRQRVLAKGETPYVFLSYGDFGGVPGDAHENPAEYAEFIYATFKHIREQVRMGAERPRRHRGGGSDSRVVADALRAGCRRDRSETSEGRLRGAGVRRASAVIAGNGVTWINGMNAVPGALALVKEYSYHCYGGQVGIADIAALAVTHGKRTSMTECVQTTNDYNALHYDLTVGRNSAWAQGTSYGSSTLNPNDCVFSAITTTDAGGTAVYCPSSKFIRQYTKYVRPGAVRNRGDLAERIVRARGLHQRGTASTARWSRLRTPAPSR